MSETRYITEYSYPEDLPAKDKIPENAVIKQIPYEVSDEQLEAELETQAREEAMAEITAKKKAEIIARSK